jgi:3-oxoacyl-[acyl-carrier protein] reductase
MSEIARRLEGKVAVVTGSGRGIGRSEALQLARYGARIIVSDIGVDTEGRRTARSVADEIVANGGEAESVTEDLMVEAGAKRTIEAAVEYFGRVDIVVNNAGLRGGNPVDKLTEEQWDKVIGSHLKASFLMIKHAVPILRTQGGGVIINTGSEAGLGMIFNSAYAAAKEGLAGLTRSVAREQGRFNIRCNLVRPRAIADAAGGDWFQTNMRGKWRPLVDALGPYWMGNRGLDGFDQVITSDPVAAFVTWLCTPAAENLNGRDFFIGGNEFAILSPPQFVSTFMHENGWDVEAFDNFARATTSKLTNAFLVPNPLEDD